MKQNRSFNKRVIALAALLLGAACSRPSARPEAKAETSKKSAELTGVVSFSAEQVAHGGVKWAVAESSPSASAVEVPGQLVPNEDRTARVGAPAQARVMSVHVRVGQRVAPGHPLVTLQSPQASAAHADVRKAEAEVGSRKSALAYARSARGRAERLLAAKAAAQQEVERALADEALAQSGLAQTEAELARARGVLGNLGSVSPSGELTVRSTVGGVVLTREATAGSVVEPGAPLVSVTDDSTLWLEMALADRAASGLRVGQGVGFTVPAYPDETFAAKVESVGGALDEKTRTLPVRALVANRDRKLRPQMFATVLVETGPSVPAVALPEGAVVLVDEKPAVFVAKPGADGGATFERRDVEVGAKRAGKVFIRQGVRPGETVVVDGAFSIKSQLDRSKLPAE